MDVDVGSTIATKYELLRLLGKGAMGEVWIAQHTSLAEKVAIKLLREDTSGPGADDIETARKRFLFEAQAAAKLSRKTRHIVSVTDHGVEGDVVYLVMELLEGENLDVFLSRAGRQQIGFALDVVNQTARGLAQAHAEGVFHRDLKPANIFLARDEDNKRIVKILDFGLARSLTAPRSTKRGIVLGSPSYMSPEQARGLGSLDYRCDVWALAVVTYKMLTSELPFGSVSPEDALMRIVRSDYTPVGEYRPDLPPELEGFFARAFAKQLSDRFENAALLAAALQRIADIERRTRPTPLQRPAVVERPRLELSLEQSAPVPAEAPPVEAPPAPAPIGPPASPGAVVAAVEESSLAAAVRKAEAVERARQGATPPKSSSRESWAVTRAFRRKPALALAVGIAATVLILVPLLVALLSRGAQ